eukprot:1160179-Pelagomonas_calceolata.AAC.18
MRALCDSRLGSQQGCDHRAASCELRGRRAVEVHVHESAGDGQGSEGASSIMSLTLRKCTGKNGESTEECTSTRTWQHGRAAQVQEQPSHTPASNSTQSPWPPPPDPAPSLPPKWASHQRLRAWAWRRLQHLPGWPADPTLQGGSSGMRRCRRSIARRHKWHVEVQSQSLVELEKGSGGNSNEASALHAYMLAGVMP